MEREIVLMHAALCIFFEFNVDRITAALDILRELVINDEIGFQKAADGKNWEVVKGAPKN